jgi:hypothetical protein
LPPALTTAASTAAFAAGFIEMMYFAFAPRSSALVGTIVEVSEKILNPITAKSRALALIVLFTSSPKIPFNSTVLQGKWYGLWIGKTMVTRDVSGQY